MITDEGRQLGQHWDRVGSAALDQYLIQDVEHPAYNPQSVLIRAFIVDRFCPGEANEIIEEELYYSACACFGLLGHREGWFPDLYRKLKCGCSDDDFPRFLQSDLRGRFGSRFDLLELYSQIETCLAVGFDSFASPFEGVWRDFLSNRAVPSCRVLELGCGSANDYRFFDSYGLANLIDYSGIDVSASNIHNATKRFPNIRFTVGDACAIDTADQTFDIAIAFDLYEHLSSTALAAALAESLRVTSDELWISFFNAANTPNHEIKPVDDYHWNLLSLPELTKEIRAAGFDVEIISTSEQFEGRFQGYHHYNREANILIASRNSTRGVQDAGEE